MNQIISWI